MYALIIFVQPYEPVTGQKDPIYSLEQRMAAQNPYNMVGQRDIST